MREPKPPGYYVTGTDTGVGKTLVSTVMLHALHGRGVQVAGMKPVASGCTDTAEGWRNDDALALQAASSTNPRYDDVNPYALPLATAPQIAASVVGVEVSLPTIHNAFARLRHDAEFVVVEGVGGWMAPLANGVEQSALVASLGLPVIMVVGLKLGCLNHARLTERAIAADGGHLLGWIVSSIDPGLEHADAYLRLLRAELQTPWLGTVPFAPDSKATALVGHLRLPA